MKKYQTMYLRIKGDIDSGILGPGERLPSVREEASASGVSVNTVISAYNILADEGLIRARERGGYYVRAARLPLTRKDLIDALSPSEKFAAAAKEAGNRLDRLYERLLDIDGSFAVASPGPDILPAEDLGRAARGLNTAWVPYGAPEGDAALRRRIAITSQDTCGPTSPDDIIVTNGATEAMALILRTRLSSGDTVALESPTYMNYFRQLAPLGVKIVEIPVGEDGMDLDLLEETLSGRDIRMIITQPNVQNPTGTTMSDSGKARLVALAENYDADLVQDDVYGDIFFGRFRPRNLCLYSDYPRLFLVSAFSKTLSPGLRVGWIRASSRYTGIFAEEKLRTSFDTCRAAQAILSGYVGTTAHRRHLAALKLALKERIDAHIERLSEVLPEGSAVRRPTGGCLIWIALPPSVNATEVFERCAGKGLIAAPGQLFSASGFFDNYLRLNAGGRLTKKRAEALSILGESAVRCARWPCRPQGGNP